MQFLEVSSSKHSMLTSSTALSVYFISGGDVSIYKKQLLTMYFLILQNGSFKWREIMIGISIIVGKMSEKNLVGTILWIML